MPKMPGHVEHLLCANMSENAFMLSQNNEPKLQIVKLHFWLLSPNSSVLSSLLHRLLLRQQIARVSTQWFAQRTCFSEEPVDLLHEALALLVQGHDF